MITEKYSGIQKLFTKLWKTVPTNLKNVHNLKNSNKCSLIPKMFTNLGKCSWFKKMFTNLEKMFTIQKMFDSSQNVHEFEKMFKIFKN